LQTSLATPSQQSSQSCCVKVKKKNASLKQTHTPANKWKRVQTSTHTHTHTHTQGHQHRSKVHLESSRAVTLHGAWESKSPAVFPSFFSFSPLIFSLLRALRIFCCVAAKGPFSDFFSAAKGRC
jgi:hypothetical protein